MPQTIESHVPDCIDVPPRRWGWHWKQFERARFPSYNRNRSLFGRMLNDIYEIGIRSFRDSLTFQGGKGSAQMQIRRNAPDIIEKAYETAYENTAREFAMGWESNKKQLIDNLFIGEEPDEDEDQDIATLALLAVRDYFTAQLFRQGRQLTLQEHIQNITNTHAAIFTQNLQRQAIEFLGMNPGDRIPPLSVGQINAIALATRSRLRSTVTPVHSRYFSTTETVSASNLGILAVARAQQRRTGKMLHKMWLSQRDARVREDHAVADSQSIPLEALFRVGNSMLAFPGDWTHGAQMRQIINCRCVLIFQTQN